MTRPSKRAQVEALGWTLAAVPRRWEAGALWTDSRTGMQSAAHDDYKNPEAWIATPPARLNLAPRRFEGSSPVRAVRWAYDQAMAPEPAVLGGVAALAQLMATASKSGVVAEGGDEPAAPALPDGELLALCREIVGCDRIAEAGRRGCVNPWDQPASFKAAQARLSEAVRDKERLIPLVIELQATTPAGALAKLQVVAGLFASSRGKRSAAVQAVAADLARVLLGQAGGAGAGL